MLRRLWGPCAGVAAALVVIAVPVPAHAATTSLQEKVATWDRAAARLGTAGSLWDPLRTFGLPRVGRITVLGDNLMVARGRVTGGETTVAAQYGRGKVSFTIAESWVGTGWAAEPAFSTSMAKVGTVQIPLGSPRARVRVTATVSANCFVQPTDADPEEVPDWFRCTKSQVRTTGGVLTMTARPSSTMSAPGTTQIVIQSTGLTYEQLVGVASGLQQVAGAPAEGAGSAQMLGMCRQMVDRRLNAAQAQTFAAENGYTTRVGMIDGVPQPVTSDYRPDRFTLSTVVGAVRSCTYG